MSHTPTPWKADHKGCAASDGLPCVVGSNNALLFMAAHSGEKGRANVDAVVERVNGWDALVEANALYRQEADTLRAERDALRKGVERLASMEAFGLARAVSPEQDDELLARIDFARALLEAK